MNEALPYRTIDSAPKTGDEFWTYAPPAYARDGTLGAASIDLTYWDDDLKEFIRYGCGFQYVTHWLPYEVLLLPEHRGMADKL